MTPKWTLRLAPKMGPKWTLFWTPQMAPSDPPNPVFHPFWGCVTKWPHPKWPLLAPKMGSFWDHNGSKGSSQGHTILGTTNGPYLISPIRRSHLSPNGPIWGGDPPRPLLVSPKVARHHLLTMQEWRSVLLNCPKTRRRNRVTRYIWGYPG